MKPRDNLRHGRKATDLIEEAVHLLRHAGAGTLAAYYAGALPFALGLLFFWSDMARSPFAPGHLAEGSLGLAVLFLWMKFWQTIFIGGLRARLSGASAPKLSLARCRRILIAQTALQSSGLFILPLALIPTLPFPWVYAFYQNISVLGDLEVQGLGDLCKRAWRQSVLWPRQNHFVLSITAGFALFVFLNWLTAGFALPQLVKMLFGVETVFSRGGTAMLNSTFFAATLTLTYLCVDPLMKAVYTLRCFYGESVTSGEDLKAELKQYHAAPGAVAACFALVLLLGGAQPLHADTTATAAPGAQPATQTISPPALNKAIEQTIDQSKYTWRMPREKLAADNDEPPGILSRFFDRVAKMLREWAKAVLQWLWKWFSKLLDWLDRLFHKHHPGQSPESSGYGWIMALQILLYTLLAAVVVALAWMIYRAVRNRRKPAVVVAEAIQSTPDLTDENVGAEQLPEDGWTKLARELLARGELRLALRAFYLASLAHLAEKNLISLARFKSNHDYERELRRRAHSFPALVGIFGENIAVFDRSWYGMHDVTGDLVNEFAANVERLKGTA
jgi:hypothetical protein